MAELHFRQTFAGALMLYLSIVYRHVDRDIVHMLLHLRLTAVAYVVVVVVVFLTPLLGRMRVPARNALKHSAAS